MPDSKLHLSIEKLPFVRIVIAYALGILIQMNVFVPPLLVCGVALVASICFAISVKMPARSRYSFRWLPGLCLITLIMLCGVLTVQQRDVSQQSDWIGRMNPTELLIMLEEPPVPKPNSFKVEATVIAVNDKGWKPASGRIIVYFAKDSTLEELLKYGNTLAFKRPLQGIKNSGNPGSFDYKRHCSFKGIYHQVYLTKKDIVITKYWGGSKVTQKLLVLRDYLLELINSTVPGKDEAAIAEALLVGYRDDIDPDLLQAYSNTGVVHIIAISGMHIAMIYGLLVVLFKRIRYYKAGNAAFIVITLVVIWGFTVVAGAAASIMRAAVMFTVLLMGQIGGKQNNLINTLASSAFLLLLFNPYFLYDVGFQLSYAAVFGIAYVHKALYKTFLFENNLLKWVWGLMSVSISAQIFVLPLLIYYFHQFPLFFVISNLVAVPLSCLVLYAEIALVALGETILVSFIGQAVSVLIGWMNLFVHHLNQTAFGLLEDLHIDVIQTILLFIICFVLARWIVYRKATYFVPIPLLTVLLLVSFQVKRVFNTPSQRLVVYNVPKQTAMDILHDGSYTFIGDTSIIKNNKMVRYNLLPARQKAFCNVPGKFIHSNASFIIRNRQTVIALVNQPIKIDSAATLDALILTANPNVSLQSYKHQLTNGVVVVDANNSRSKLAQWKKEAELLHLRFHSTTDDGAFTLDL